MASATRRVYTRDSRCDGKIQAFVRMLRSYGRDRDEVRTTMGILTLRMLAREVVVAPTLQKVLRR